MTGLARSDAGGGAERSPPEAEKEVPEREPLDPPREGPGPREAKKSAERTTARPKPPPAKSVDEQYVRDNLKSHLVPQSLTVLADGRMRFVFKLHEKIEKHEKVFTPSIDKAAAGRSQFRWSNAEEERYFRGRVDGTRWTKGIRLANQGMAHLECWFADDLEAEIHYMQGTSFAPTQNLALVLTNPAGKSIGVNFGSQCAAYSSGVKSSSEGAVESLEAFQPASFKLVVKEGKIKAYRDGKLKARMEYKQKDFPSGRLGLLWNGGMAGYIYSLEIIGRVDVKKMAEAIRKAR